MIGYFNLSFWSRLLSGLKSRADCLLWLLNYLSKTQYGISLVFESPKTSLQLGAQVHRDIHATLQTVEQVVLFNERDDAWHIWRKVNSPLHRPLSIHLRLTALFAYFTDLHLDSDREKNLQFTAVCLQEGVRLSKCIHQGSLQTKNIYYYYWYMYIYTMYMYTINN